MSPPDSTYRRIYFQEDMMGPTFKVRGRVLITGPSGVGKSTVCRFFRAHGVRAYDGDDVQRLGGPVDLRGRPLRAVTKHQWRQINDWRFHWDAAVLKRFLSRHRDVVLFGAADNLFDLDLTRLFDRRYFLQASWPVLRVRLNDPSRDNDWGRDEQPAQRKWVKRAALQWPAKARSQGFEFIDAESKPISILRRVCNRTDADHGTASRHRGVRRIEPAFVSDMFWEFARAEVQNDRRHGRKYSRGLGNELFDRVRSGNRHWLDRAALARLRSTVLSTRPEYLASLPSLGLRWCYAELPTRELPCLRVPDLDIFRPTAPTHILEELVTALDSRARNLWPPVERNYRKMRPNFDPTRMVGTPIVIGTSLRGPFTIVEGLTRLCVLTSLSREIERISPSTRLLFGVGARARSWKFF